MVSVFSLWRYPVRTTERCWGSYKAGFEVLGLSLILNEANIHRAQQVLANCMRAFFQRLRRNEPNESGAQNFSVLSDDERQNLIMNNPTLANRTDKDVRTKTDNDLTDNDVTDNDVTMVPATANIRPRRLRTETLGIVYGMKIFAVSHFSYSECTRHCIALQKGMARVSWEGDWAQYGMARVLPKLRERLIQTVNNQIVLKRSF